MEVWFEPTKLSNKTTTQLLHSLLPSLVEWAGENTTKGWKVETNDREGYLTNYGHRKKTDLGKQNQFNLNNKITTNLAIGNSRQLAWLYQGQLLPDQPSGFPSRRDCICGQGKSHRCCLSGLLKNLLQGPSLPPKSLPLNWRHGFDG